MEGAGCKALSNTQSLDLNTVPRENRLLLQQPVTFLVQTIIGY